MRNNILYNILRAKHLNHGRLPYIYFKCGVLYAPTHRGSKAYYKITTIIIIIIKHHRTLQREIGFNLAITGWLDDKHRHPAPCVII